MKISYIYTLVLLSFTLPSFAHAKVDCPPMSFLALKSILNNDTLNRDDLALRYGDTDVKKRSLKEPKGKQQLLSEDNITFKDDEIIGKGYLLCTYDIKDKAGTLKATVKISARAL